jgi:hypothetical protein
MNLKHHFSHTFYLVMLLSKKKKEYTSLTHQGSLNWNNTFETTKITYIHGFIFAFLISNPRDEAYLFKESSIYIPIFIFASSLIVLVISDNFSSYWYSSS